MIHSLSSDFDRNDYSSVWKGKGLEDAAQKRILRALIPHGERCLELGSGYGRITQVLEPYFETVVALDGSARNLSVARRTLHNVDLGRADAAEIPFRDSCFDCVVMVRVIHLLPELEKVMSEILRVSRAEANVILTVPNLALNSLLWGVKGALLPPGLRNRTPTFGHAAWRYGTSPYFLTPEHITPRSFKLVARRGTGFFDNAAGKVLERFSGLHLVDVATSPIWWIKLDIFLKFVVRK